VQPEGAVAGAPSARRPAQQRSQRSRTPPAPITGWCFDVQRYSLHDGPGIRTTVFLKGCPLACLWCHNPEGINPRPEIRVWPDRCHQMLACRSACPRGLADGPHLPDPDQCLRCGACADACPTGARQLVGRAVTPAQLLELVERDRPFYDESGGGVTFSGGEPLLQPGFLLACLQMARERGLHTVVDTCGFAGLGVIRAVAERTNLFLYDVKVLDDERHRRYTGVPLHPVIRNLQALDRLGARIWLRMPLVPGYNDDGPNLDRVADLILQLRGTRRLHLLPYHRFGIDKYQTLGQAIPVEGLRPPTQAALDAAVARLRRRGVDVHVGG